MTKPSPQAALRAMVLLSGLCALGYQSFWLRLFHLAMGSTTAASAWILAYFMGGLALGAWAFPRLALAPGMGTYAKLEAGIGLGALWASALLWPLSQESLLNLLALTPAARIALAGIAVVPSAALCGMTLPALMEGWGQDEDKVQRLSWLYEYNTLGAVLGAMLGPFVLLPWLGLQGGIVALALLNGSIALAAWRLRPALVPAPAQQAAETPGASKPTLLILAAIISGTAAFILEVAWTRTLAMTLGSSTYAFGLMLAAMLLGIALGARLLQWRGPAAGPALGLLAALYATLGALILLNHAALGQLPSLLFELLRRFKPEFHAYQAIQFGLCFALLLPVTLLQGYAFPLLLRLADGGHSVARGAAALLAWNTAGAVAGALLAGYALIPWVGLQGCYVLAAGLCLAQGLLLWARSRRWPSLGLAFGTGAVALLAAYFSTRYRTWDPLLMSSGAYYSAASLGDPAQPGQSLRSLHRAENELLYYKEGREATVAVRRSKTDTALVINGKVDASLDGDSSTQKLLAHFPLLNHPRPDDVMVIGWGSGSTAGSAALHPLKSLTCVEIEPAAFEAGPFFSAVNFEVWKDPRFKLQLKDGRSALLASANRYDVIISEPSNPWISGVANLFTEDFYRIALSRLKPEGLFAQWFHFYNMSEADLRMEIRTFGRVFPGHSLWFIPHPGDKPLLSGDLLLLGSHSPLALSYALPAERMRQAPIAADLARTGIEDPFILLSHRLLDQEELLRFAGSGPLNTDDRPRIELSAPRSLVQSMLRGAQDAFATFSAIDRAARLPFPAISDVPAGSFDSAPARAGLMARLGGYYVSQGLLERGMALLRESDRLAPKQAWTQFHLGRGHFFSRRFQEAEAPLQSALAALPRERKAYIYLGSLYFNLNDPARGLAVYSAMTRALPKDAEGWFGKGATLARLGRTEEARQNLKTCLGLDPMMQKAENLLEQLGRPQGQ